MTERGIRYLCASAGGLILACSKCGEEHFREASHYFGQPACWELCLTCQTQMEPIRVDELETRWYPFWHSLGHVIPGYKRKTKMNFAIERISFDHWQLMKTGVVAMRSRDPSTKVGCVIVRPDKSICSEGYNGFPRGMRDLDKWLNDRAEKYDRVIHAEMNALLASKEPVVGYTLYINGPPCKDCAKHICAAGIKRAVWSMESEKKFTERWGASIERSLELFKDSGVTVDRVKDYYE